MRRIGRLLIVVTLGVGSFVLIWSALGYAAPDRVAVPVDEANTLALQGGTTLVPDPRVGELMDKITTGTIVAYERTLTGEEAVMVGGIPYTITTRHSYSGEPISQATRYVYDHFQSLGLDVTFHDYTWSGHQLRNVVAEQRGLLRPNEIYLITAHLDDMPAGPVAPGADDNASGSTAVLVAADLLSRLDFDCTLRFVLFTGEEQAMRGSAAYVADIATIGEDVRGVVNLDMIGYNSGADPIIDLHTRSTVTGSLAIAETFSQVIAAYNLDLTPDILVNAWLGNHSDNKSFWDAGYPAILAIEDWDDTTPYYHTSGDGLDTLDLEYFTEFVKAGVATFAHMGCLSMGLLTGTVTARDTGLPLSATVTALRFDHAYTTATTADGYYSLTLPVFTFTVQAEANLNGYQSAVVTDVAVLSNATTVQHLALEPWPYRLFIPISLKQL